MIPYQQGLFEKAIEDEYRLYKQLYSLPTKHCYIEDTPGPFFNFCLRRRFFIIIFIYTIDHKAFVLPEFHSKILLSSLDEKELQVDFEQNIQNYYKNLLSKIQHNYSQKSSDDFIKLNGENYSAEIPVSIYRHLFEDKLSHDIKLQQCQCMYRLVSGAVKIFEKNETLIEAVIRIVNDKLKDVSIGEIRPIMHFKNHFISMERKQHIHEGIGFTCRLQMNENIYNNLYDKRSEKAEGVLVDINSIQPELFAHGWNRLCFETGREFLKKSGLVDSFDIEINISKKIKKRQKLHNSFIKPVLNLFKTDIKAYIVSRLPKKELDSPIKLLDVSCGEDDFLIKLSKQLPEESILVGNDVSWGSLKILTDLRLSEGIDNVYLTNHSASDLPYAPGYFDFSICKNTLHHLRDYNEICETVENLLRVTNGTVFIIDFEYPKITGRLPYWIHLYYKWFLKDAGDNFLSEDKFKKLFKSGKIREILERKKMSVSFEIKKSLFGKSMIAIIQCPISK